MNLIMLGAPGSGKGTIATFLAKVYDIPHISSGDIFRKNIRGSTPLGLKAEEYIKAGDLVPDSLTISMIEDRLQEADCDKGFLLDGFPRTMPQTQSLEEFLSSIGRHIDAVINILLSDQTIMYRLSGRLMCSVCGASYNTEFQPTKEPGICDRCGGEVKQRVDDRPETVRKRLATYYEQTEPLVNYFRDKGLLMELNNEDKVAKVVKKAEDQLSEMK